MVNFLQVELWEECGQRCPFCYQSRNFINKIKRLKQINNEFDNYPEHKIFGLIGGEFFEWQLNQNEVWEQWKILIKKINAKLTDGTLQQFNLCTNLTYSITHSLEDTLSILNSNIDKVLLCTSYDFKYRFKREEDRNTWKRNIEKLHRLFPKLKIHTQIIMQQATVDVILSGWNINSFCDTYKTSVDFSVPTAGNSRDDNDKNIFETKQKFLRDKKLESFFPTRESFLKVLPILQEQGYDLQRLFNREQHAQYLYYLKDGKEICYEHNGDNDHPNFRQTSERGNGYIDSNIPMRKDVEEWIQCL